MDAAEAERLIELAGESLMQHFRADPAAFEGLSWMARGGRLWLHGAPAWPLGGWKPGPWRVVSLGFRAMEFDTKGRPRPTNDVLQWLGSRLGAGGLDLSDDELIALCEGRPVARDEQLAGLQALRWRGAVVGRGVITREGVRSEISKAPSADLKGIAEGRGPATRLPADD